MFLTNFLQGTPKSDKNLQSQPRRESKIITPTLPVLDEPQRDFNLYLQIPQTSHKYMLQMDSNLQSTLDSVYEATNRYVDQDKKNQILLNLIDEFRKAKGELYKLFEEQSQKNKEILLLQDQNESFLEQLLSKDQLIQNLDCTYMEKMQDFESKIGVHKEKAESDASQLRLEVQRLKDQMDHKDRCQSALMERVRNLEAELKGSQSKCSLAEQLNKRLQDDLDVMKDLRNGSLIINKVYARLTGSVEPQHYSMSREQMFYYLFTGKFRNNMIQYFTPEDILSMVCVDRKMYFLIRNNRILIQHLVKCRTRSLKNALIDAQLDVTYFKELGERVPEEIVQQGMAKFIAFRFQAGSYFNDVLKDSFDFLDGKYDSTEMSKYDSPEMSDINEYTNIMVETTDLIGLEEDVPLPQNQMTIKQPQQEQSQPQGFFQKLMNKNKPQQQIKQPLNLSDLSKSLQTELQSLGSVSMHAFTIPFLRKQLQQTRQDMHELAERTAQLNQQIYTIGQKSAQPGARMQIPEFIRRLQSNYAKLLANSLYLRLESQQLQHTTNYLAQLALRMNRELRDQGSHAEDMQEELKTIRGMNVFLQGRLKQLEDRVIKGEEDVLVLSQQNNKVRNQAQQAIKDASDAALILKEKDQKIRLLALSLKTTNQEKKQLQQTIGVIYQGFSRLKILE